MRFYAYEVKGTDGEEEPFYHSGEVMEDNVTKAFDYAMKASLTVLEKEKKRCPYTVSSIRIALLLV